MALQWKWTDKMGKAIIRWGKKSQSERHRQRNNINPKKN